MKERVHWLERLLPSPTDNGQSDAGSTHEYTRFSRGLSVILLILVLVPLATVSVLSHYQYLDLLEQEEMDQLVLNLEAAQNTTETFISELQSVIKFVARDGRYQELIDPVELQSLFTGLKKEYPDVADIEVIDTEGIQKAYFGPYTLEDPSYTDQNWYKEVLLQGIYISNVLSGVRNVPHFVIAVSRKHPEKLGNWVLRVTIEGKTLQNIINTIGTGVSDDMFLVDEDFITQTIPQKYGKIGEKCVLYSVEDQKEYKFAATSEEPKTVIKKASGVKIVKKTFQGQKLNQATIDLKDTPWKLVLVKEQYLHANTWFLFKIKLTTMFSTCVIIAVFIILKISSAITNRMRDSDIKRQQLYLKAENSNKLASIGRLAAGVAHEINNPLAIINQKAGLVQDLMGFSDDFENKAVMAEAIDGIQSSVDRCKTITHRLLGFARQTDVKAERINVNKTLREVVDFLAKEATYNQIKIGFDLNEEMEDIWSDRGPLQQVFLNITNNAIDAIGHGGTIVLTSKQINPKTVEVTIGDDGPGMPPEVLKHIFEPFFTTKETGKGTGLGLSITYGLVKKLGGSISVKSKIGKGTIFRITLPIHQSE